MPTDAPPTVADHPADSVPTGAALIVAAFVLVATMSALGKGVGASTATIVCCQSLVSLLVFLPWSLHRGVAGLRTERLPLHVVRAAGGLLSQALMFLAILKMPLMNAVLLSNSAPLFIPIVAWLWLGERVGGRTIASLIVGFVGVALILRPGPALLHKPAALLAVAAAICSAIALVTVNRLSATEPTFRVLFYYFAIGALMSAPFVPFGWRTPTAAQWLALLGIGLCQAGSQLLILNAYRFARPGVIAPFNYSVVVFSGLIGWLVWHDRPGGLAIVGVLFVSLGGILTTARSLPHLHGHFGWIGRWNALALRRLHRRQACPPPSAPSPAPTFAAS